MDRLSLHLPTLDEDWIYTYQVDIEEKALAEFHISRIDQWARELDSSDFEEKYEEVKYNPSDNQRWEEFYKDNYLYYKIPQYAQHVFEEQGIWNTTINTEELVDTYNESLVGLYHLLAFNIALSWARYLDCEVKEDHGVTPYKSEE